MPLPVDCCSCCTTAVTTNLVGSSGATGEAGDNGVNAFTTITDAGGIVIPAIAATVDVAVADNSWAAIGQVVFLSDETDMGTFTVTTLTGTTSMNLTFLGATGDSAPGATIDSGGMVSPAGQPGAGVADPLPVANGGTGYAVLPAEAHYDLADPAVTVSATEVMMGLGGTATITPTTSGKLFIVVTGMIANAILGKGSSVQLRYGTGVAPVHGVAAAGTTLGSVKNFVEAAATCATGISLAYVVSGLTPTTAYWIDLGLYAVGGGGSEAKLTDIDIVAMEL